MQVALYMCYLHSVLSSYMKFSCFLGFKFFRQRFKGANRILDGLHADTISQPEIAGAAKAAAGYD